MGTGMAKIATIEAAQKQAEMRRVEHLPVPASQCKAPKRLLVASGRGGSGKTSTSHNCPSALRMMVCVSRWWTLTDKPHFRAERTPPYDARR